ncbi:uncharacterized protein AB9X84_017537 [Acanthopagrus schlegelii]
MEQMEIFECEGKTLPYSLTIIDTPGYGDTRGIERDAAVSERLLDLFRSADGVHEINAVGLVLKATENHLNDRLMYIFDSVMSLFGKNMEQNIVALITHSDGLMPENSLKALKDANIKCAKDEDVVQAPGPVLEALQRCHQAASEHQRDIIGSARVRGRRAVCISGGVIEPVATTCPEQLAGQVVLFEPAESSLPAGLLASPCLIRVTRGTACVPVVNVGTIYVLLYPRTGLGTISSAQVISLPAGVTEVKSTTASVSFQQAAGVAPGRVEAVDLSALGDETVKEVHYLGHIISSQGVSIDHVEIEAVAKWQHPCQVPELRSFLGFTSYYRRFVEGFAKLASRLHKLVAELAELPDDDKRKTKGSVKYEDIISKSRLVRSGSPAVYQLTPKKEEIGSLRRMTLGEKDVNKTNRTILLVGETGAGKSALVNSLVNYTMGVKWEDDVWFQIVEEEKRNQSESQTPDVIVYQIFGCEGKTLPYSLTIIDTPGYGDTRGIERDAAVSERLLDWFRSDDGVHEINAVGLMLKATENRLSDRLMYIFDSVVSLFGKDMEQNIVALITHSSGPTYKNALKALEAANIKCAKDEKNQLVHFLFDNSQHEDRTEDTEELQHAFTKTTKGLKKFTDFLEKTKPQQLKTTVEVLNERIRLTACIQNLKERIQLTELKKTEIQQIQEVLKKHEEEMKKDEEFTVEVDEPYKEKQTISAGGLLFYKGATCCTVCEENCHYPGCTLAWSPQSCEVMKDGRCTSCTRKCPVSDHVKEDWIYVTKTRRVKKTLQDVKKKYEKKKTDFESLLNNLKKEIEELEKEKDQMLDESFHHVVNLQQIALKVDSLSTLVHLDFLIEKMKEKGDTEKIQKLEEMKSRVDERTRAAMRYRQTGSAEEVKK